EADCNWVDFRKEKQRDPIFDPFSFGLSYRIGFRIWDCLIPYALAGMEYSFLRGDGGAQFREVGMIRYNSNIGGGGVVDHNVPATRLAYNLDHKRIMQSPRFGFGFELEFLRRFRFRCDCFWTNKSAASNFRTEVLSLANPLPLGLLASYSGESKMNLRVRRFTTRFGVVMLF
ncbi:MAG: hypothetical protein LBI30_01510, partial [Holosporales bacterium]|nr:hypothetical protein [Holosporales bacterium]